MQGGVCPRCLAEFCQKEADAGADYTVPATDVDMDEAHSTFNTNFFGVIQMTQTFLPLLLKSKGMIVQIGSLAGIMPFVFGAGTLCAAFFLPH